MNAKVFSLGGVIFTMFLQTFSTYFFLQKHNVLIFLLLCFSNSSFAAWNLDFLLPSLNSQVYSTATGNTHSISIGYSSQAIDIASAIPVPPLPPGRNLRIRVLAPPGTAIASIWAQSNEWQGRPIPTGQTYANVGSFPLMGSFDTDPGDLCKQQNATSSPAIPACPTGRNLIYFDDLHPAGGGLNDQLYGNGSPAYPPLTEARYLYFVLTHPINAIDSFKLQSLRISLFITDTVAYNNWLSQRPWAGGSSNNITGIGGDIATITQPIVDTNAPSNNNNAQTPSIITNPIIPVNNDTVIVNDADFERGKRYCIDNPLPCGLSRIRQEDIDTAIELAKKECLDDPASCGINTQITDTDEQIIQTACQQDPASCGIAQGGEEQCTDADFATVRDACQQDPSSCGIDINNSEQNIGQVSADLKIILPLLTYTPLVGDPVSLRANFQAYENKSEADNLLFELIDFEILETEEPTQ